MTHLRGQTLEERPQTLLADHIPNDSHAGDVAVEVGVLDTGLDDVERGGDCDGGDGAGDGCDEV